MSVRGDTVSVGRHRFSYSWVVVGALALTSLVIQGIALGGITLFDTQLLAVLHISRGALKLRDSLFLLSSAGFCFVLGRICEAIGVRTTMLLGLAVMTGIMVSYSLIPPLWVIYLLHVALGFSLATAHVVLIMIVLSRWFAPDDARRGIALGFSVAGASIGAVVMSQSIAWGLARFEWNRVFLGLALIPMLVMPVVWWAVRAPAEGNTKGWGLDRSQGGAGFLLAFRAVFRSRSTALLLASIVPIFYVSACLFAHVVLLLRDQGLSLQAAAGGVSVLFICGLIGKLGSGFCLTRFELKAVWIAFTALMLAGSVLLWAWPVATHTLAIALIGLGWGGCFPLTQLRIAVLSPGPNLARVLGLFVVLESFGAAAGAWFTGFLYDHTGSYEVALALNTTLLLAACIAAFAPVRMIQKWTPEPEI